MAQTDTTLDDVGQAINDLGTMISEKIDALDKGLGGRIDGLETKMEKGFKEIGGGLEAIENDVKAIYKMLADVQKAVGKLRKSDKELDRRLTTLEQFAEKLSLKTGIPFEP